MLAKRIGRQSKSKTKNIWGFLVSIFLCSGMLLKHELAFAIPSERYTVVTVDVRQQTLELFWADEQGQVFRHFDTLSKWLEPRGKNLVFAMNAGMYHYDFSPVGLLLIRGRELAPLNLDEGFGNFFLKPNGVFLWNKESAMVLESSEYPRYASTAVFATQSGPLILRHSQIHARFDPLSSSRHIRNGVGVKGNQVYFVISNQAVNFYEFAQYFRDELACTDALYFDGSISSMWAPSMGRGNNKNALGPIVGVVEDRKP